MYHVRYYAQEIHPDEFRGRLGFWIRVFNFIRWRLEVFVQRLVLRYMANQANLPKEKRFEFRRVFELDDAAEKLLKEQTSPLVQKIELPAQPTVTRSDRYADGRQASALETSHAEENDAPLRPKRMNNMIAAYASPDRSKKYGRRYFTADPDGDFEPLDANEGQG